MTNESTPSRTNDAPIRAQVPAAAAKKAVLPAPQKPPKCWISIRRGRGWTKLIEFVEAERAWEMSEAKFVEFITQRYGGGFSFTLISQQGKTMTYKYIIDLTAHEPNDDMQAILADIDRPKMRGPTVQDRITEAAGEQVAMEIQIANEFRKAVFDQELQAAVARINGAGKPDPEIEKLKIEAAEMRGRLAAIEEMRSKGGAPAAGADKGGDIFDQLDTLVQKLQQGDRIKRQLAGLGESDSWKADAVKVAQDYRQVFERYLQPKADDSGKKPADSKQGVQQQTKLDG